MAILKEKVETGRNTDITLLFLVNNKAIDHKQLTRVQLYVGEVLLDSLVGDPDVFDFSQSAGLVVRLGQAGLAPGRYLCRVYLFDSVNTLGRPWDDDVLMVEVL